MCIESGTRKVEKIFKGNKEMGERGNKEGLLLINLIKIIYIDDKLDISLFS